MNRKNLELWLNDLRTTDAPQTVGVLHDLKSGGFCCLGRLCEVAITAGCQIGVGVRAKYALYDGDETMPPTMAREWLGLHDHPDFFDDCTEWNDTDELAFSEIADSVEEWLRGQGAA